MAALLLTTLMFCVLSLVYVGVFICAVFFNGEARITVLIVRVGVMLVRPVLCGCRYY